MKVIHSNKPISQYLNISISLLAQPSLKIERLNLDCFNDTFTQLDELNVIFIDECADVEDTLFALTDENGYIHLSKVLKSLP